MKGAFAGYHPIVNFTYFMLVLACSMFFMHPACLAVSLLCGLLYSVRLKGRRALWFCLLALLPLMLASALMNPAFNHEGVTILAYLPSGNPLTLESILYGAAAAAMLASVVCWFSCYHAVMTSDKFIYLFGRVIPSLSLLLSMALRFVPRLAAQAKVVANAQRCVGRDMMCGGVIQRAKNGLAIVSALVTWSLENAIETADSMKSRGYGLPGRSAFSIYTFDSRDRQALAAVCLAGLYSICGAMAGGLGFQYFPLIKGVPFTAFTASVFLAYFVLCAMPLVIEWREGRRWKAIESIM